MRAAPVLAVLILSSGCNDLPPIKHETTHLRIGTGFDGPVCAGTLHEFDQQVEFVERTLDLQLEDKLELYLFVDGVDDWCEHDDVPGCYSHDHKQAYSTFPAARHEIVHAVLGQGHTGSGLFDEGFAVDLTGEGLSFPATYPSSNLGLPPGDVSHRTAGHFMRWLRSRYTADELKSIWLNTKQKKGAKHAATAFHDATGDDFHAIEQVYFDSAPEFFAPFDIVEPPIIPSEQDGWDILLEFDCERIETEGINDEMWRRVRIGVSAPGHYAFVVTWPATATIRLHRTENIQVGDALPERPWWPIGDDLFDPPEPWLPNVSEVTWLDVGIYDIEVHVPGVSKTKAAIRIYPQLGPISEVP